MTNTKKVDEAWDTDGLGAVLRRLAELEEQVAYPLTAPTSVNDERHLRLGAELRRIAALALD